MVSAQIRNNLPLISERVCIFLTLLATAVHYLLLHTALLSFVAVLPEVRVPLEKHARSDNSEIVEQPELYSELRKVGSSQKN